MTRKEGWRGKGTKSGRCFEEMVNIPMERSKSGKSTLPEPKYSKSKDVTTTVMKRFRVTRRSWPQKASQRAPIERSKARPRETERRPS